VDNGGSQGRPGGLRAAVYARLEEISFRSGLMAAMIGLAALAVIASAGVVVAELGPGGGPKDALTAARPAAATAAPTAAPSSRPASPTASPSSTPSTRPSPKATASPRTTPVSQSQSQSQPQAANPATAPSGGSVPCSGGHARGPGGGRHRHHGPGFPGFPHPGGWGGHR
jgi:hypothetical protein